MNDLNDELKDFDTLPVAFLLQGKQSPFTFHIPSFQRGYRWEEKHVKDMLDDLYEFVGSNQTSYFLQPLVVRRTQDERVWEVLDGQQRLTTMLLILKQFSKRINADDAEDYQLYSIQYIQRVTPDFDNPNPLRDLDSYYLLKAKNVISQWYEEKRKNGDKSILDAITHALYYPDNKQKVKFIWYVVSENETTQTSDLNTIKVFNRLNKGKISLTSSELIKALFYMKFKSSHNKLDVDRFSLEWDQMEKQFEKDEFWYFISDRQEDVGTRMDVLFDYVANIDYRKDDSLDSYRFFQKRYDLNPEGFESVWEEVKQVYDMFLRWYEDTRLYNYIGYLVWKKRLPRYIKEQIYKQSPQLDEDTLLKIIRDLIRTEVSYENYRSNTERSFDEWTYSSDIKKIREMLLLFNIETYNKANMRFPFDLFKKEKWDVEHVDSQKDNNMQELDHKVVWIELVVEQLQYDPNSQARILEEKGHALLTKFEKDGQDSNNVFKLFYDEVYAYYNEEDNDVDKDTIDNLALLNSGINRGYKNAPFPCKRSIIIQNDEQGIFIPLCTRNLFLKYYTGSNRGASQLDMIRWNNTDRKAYIEKLIQMLKYYM